MVQQKKDRSASLTTPNSNAHVHRAEFGTKQKLNQLAIIRRKSLKKKGCSVQNREEISPNLLERTFGDRFNSKFQNAHCGHTLRECHAGSAHDVQKSSSQTGHQCTKCDISPVELSVVPRKVNQENKAFAAIAAASAKSAKAR